jgi:adenylate kinase family enzyme
MIRRKWIKEITNDLSFCDAGGLWGIVNENISDALNAKSKTLLDKFPTTDPLWQQMREHLVGVDYEEVSSNICDVKRQWDVVGCNGVIYHYPEPENILKMLKEMFNKFLIITTTFTQPTVSNNKGCITIDDKLYLPNINESTREVIKEDWKIFLHNQPVSGLTYVSNWQTSIYEHWWWLFTENYLDNLFYKTNLSIIEKVVENDGKVLSYLLKHKKSFI